VEQVEWPWICGSPQRRLEPRARRRRFPDGDPDGSDVAPVAAEPAVRGRDAEGLEAALMAAGVPCARVNNFKEVFDDPQIVARSMVQEIEHPRLGAMRTVRNPVLLDHDGPSLARHSPTLGEHSAEVLGELGYSEAAVSDLAAAGVTRLAGATHERPSRPKSDAAENSARSLSPLGRGSG